MKKFFTLFLALALCLSMAACAKSEEEEQELIMFAAASMTETLQKIAEDYKKVEPNVKLTFNFDSSGTLKTQIEEGAACDLFLSAAQKQMNQLEEAGSLLTDTRVNLLENQVTLVVPEGNPAGITGFDDVKGDQVGLIALGNSDVPVGQYSEELFTNMGIWEEIQNKITFGSNVKEVTAWVAEGTVDCGVVYGTDARAAGLPVVATAPEELLDNRVVYPAAVLKSSEHEKAARAFLTYLQGENCRAVFEDAGFAIPN